MLNWYKADLHIHTVLSPCAELTMGPIDIVKAAVRQKIDIIAITDHNSAENIQAVMDAAKGTSLFVIPGIEVYSREDAHLITLFPDMDSVLAFQDYLYQHLMPGEYDASMLGPQYICDADENIIAESKRMLSLPVDQSVYAISDKVTENGGIIYPAHIDRQSHSLLRCLGSIPTDLPFNAVEISQSWETAVRNFRFLKNTPLSVITASDAHDISLLGSKTTWFYLEKPCFTEIVKALGRHDGRKTSLVAEA